MDAGGLAYLLAAALLGGLIRGFTGFGGALVLAPLLLLRLAPIEATATVMLINVAIALGQLSSLKRQCDWHVIGRVTLVGCIFAPIGLFVVARLPVDIIRPVVAIIVLAATALLAMKLRLPLHLERTAHALMIGSASGLMFALGGIGGPPVILSMLARDMPARVARASLVSYFSIVQTVTILVMAVAGLIRFDDLGRAALLLPAYALGNYIGHHALTPAREPLFRTVSLGVLAAVGLIALLS